jgi:ubiquinol-cytochrome c reductase iron-sulfur subunit
MAQAIGLSESPEPAPQEPTRRDFINILTGTAAIGGTAAFAWPFIDQLNPAANALAQGLPVAVDLTKVQPGQQITVLWRKMPIFIVHRTPALLAELTKPSDLGLLRDPDSKARQQPAYAKNWCRSIRPEFLVLVGVCTHLGCTPSYEPALGSLGPRWPGGWLCPCHGSRYDLAGRVFKSVPAPLNLPVPPYRFASDTSVVIGANPPGSTFQMSEIETT